MNKKSIIISTILGIAAAGLTAPLAEASGTEEVKCKGVSTKWVNGCDANGHACSGAAQTDFDPNEWLLMTQNDCNAVQNALMNPAVKNYVLTVRDGTVTASGKGKEF